MSNPTPFPQPESQSSPERYPPFNPEPSHPHHNKLPSIPVFFYLSVPSQLVPSTLRASSTHATPHLPSPPSSRSDSGSEGSAALEARGTSTASSGTLNNPFGFEFGQACDVDGLLSSSPKTTSLAPSHEQTPVALPISATEWNKILSEVSDNAAGASERFARIVEGDLMRVNSYLKDMSSGQQHNRLANDDTKRTNL